MESVPRQVDELAYMPATKLADAIKRREISPVEVVDAALDRIERYEPMVNAFITLLADDARAAAKVSEQEVMSRPAEELGRLHGVPIAVKDLTPTAGVRTTYGALNHANYVPDEDSAAWARIKAESPILLGKTATPPMGALVVTESELNGRTNNPWDVSRTVGGSSGGSAAAVAAGFTALSTGSDGGASIRLPSGFCGVVGLKPSPGRIPSQPEISPFDTSVVVGPITRTVLDNALLLDVMSGPHPYDPFALDAPAASFVETASRDLPSGRRIAFCTEGFGPAEPDVLQSMTELAAHVEAELGSKVEFVPLNLPDIFEYFYDFWTSGMGPELFEAGEELKQYPPLMDWLARADRVKVSTYLDAAFDRRFQIRSELQGVFDRFDFIITPTTPSVAFPHPGRELLGPSHVAGQPTTIPAVDAGRFLDAPTQGNYPALTLPCGFSADGLPYGAQIVGPRNADGPVLQVAAALERSLGLLDRKPF